MSTRNEIVLKGQGVAPGIAIGKVLFLERRAEHSGPASIDSSLAEQELQRFEQALANTKKELLEIARTVASQLDAKHVQIFEAQIMLLDDPEVRKEVHKEIRENLKSAVTAYREVLEKTVSALASSENQYLKERVSDLQAIKSRVLQQLSGHIGGQGMELSSPSVILADFLSPGELIQLNRQHILGLALKEAGTTSHVALLSKAFNIPTVVAWENGVELQNQEAQAVIDGSNGQVILFPDADTLQFYQRRKKLWEAEQFRIQKKSQLPTVTKDKAKINLLTNIDMPEEAQTALKYGAQGVGLFRTEFLFLSTEGFPSEEEQYQIYAQILEKFNPWPVTIRTTDLGGDKLFGTSEDSKDLNPFLGWRAVRVCLDSPGLFKTQLRALYRASAKGNLKIMIPMVSCTEEIDKIDKVIREVQRELRREKISFKPDIPVGIMIEIPSAALNASGLAKKVDFFSLGTNDLTQYTLAVDRGNQKIARLFDELDPGVLRLMELTVRAAKKARIEVSICGELAASTLALPALLGLGLNTISVSPVHLPRVKEMLRKINLSRARNLTRQLLQMTDRREVRKALKKFSK